MGGPDGSTKFSAIRGSDEGGMGSVCKGMPAWQGRG